MIYKIKITLGERLYIRLRSNVHILHYLGNKYIYLSINYILKIQDVLAQKLQQNVYVNQDDFLSNSHILIKYLKKYFLALAKVKYFYVTKSKILRR